MRTTSFGYECKFRRLYGGIGDAETKSNGRRGREESIEWDVTIRNIQREVCIYKVYNENFMKYWMEILQILNML